MMKQSTEQIILEARDVYFSYEGEKAHALNGLSLTINKGHKIALMGANGSGKSTFFLCCNGIHKPSKGEMLFHGKPMKYDRKALLNIRSKIGIVFQDPDNQLFSASVYEEISFGILNLGVEEEMAKEKVEQIMEELEIGGFRDKPTHALSGGQKKQVSIADILIMDPEIIIFDEPAAALDPKHTKIVNEVLNKLTEKGITVIVSTHDVNFACEWADDIILFHNGTVLMEGTYEEIFTNKTALVQTNLEQPACIELYNSLNKKGILKPGLPVPRTLKALENYIEKIGNQVYTGMKTESHKPEKKGLLVVSFGTSVNATREKTIDAIEKDLSSANSDCTMYRAWTSGMIIRKLKKRDGVHVDTVKEAVDKMYQEGITEIIVAPTHVINGIENDLMKEQILSRRNDFTKISFADPLLTTEQDSEKLILAVMDEFPPLKEKEALVFMGHGTTHYANSIYAALDYKFKDIGYENVFLGTVEAYPSMETLLKLVKAGGYTRVRLAPFMVVAGDHALNDMSGEDDNSWRSRFEQAGFEVECILKGLGEYQGVRELYESHVKVVRES